MLKVCTIAETPTIVDFFEVRAQFKSGKQVLILDNKKEERLFYLIVRISMLTLQSSKSQSVCLLLFYVNQDSLGDVILCSVQDSLSWPSYPA